MQGQQLPQEQKPKKRNPKIAVISLTTTEKRTSPNDSEQDETEPDGSAQPQMSLLHQKRLSHQQIQIQNGSPIPSKGRESPSSHQEYSDMRHTNQSERGKIKKNGLHAASKQSMAAVSMRDENIMQRSINSVTDEKYYMRHEDGNSEDSSQDYYSIKKQMIRYLSRVADRNKPMFVFNQKLNLGGDSDDDSDTGTPSFSLVALIRDK